MKVETEISFGYLPLLETFFRANNLCVTCICREEFNPTRNFTTLEYDDDSETAIQLTFMSYRHVGLENMLCDYLIRCGISPIMIPVGSFHVKRDQNEIEKQWQEHRKLIGL